MGTVGQKERKKLLISDEQDLYYYTDVLDPHLGMVSIYTSHRFKLCYILKYFHRGQDTKIYNMFKKVELNQLAHLLNLYGFSIERRSCCSRVCSQNMISYWQYYNFYFDEYLLRRGRQGLTFIDSQIWHIVQVCCQSYNIFRKFGVFYEINCETFVITPQGKLKAFWCHLRSQNHHMRYFEYFEKNHRISRFPYSPEQLQCMYQQQRNVRLDFDKCNSYRLGILLLQCLSLVEPLSTCYNPSMTAVNGASIKNLIGNKVLPNYSGEIVGLVRALLNENPEKRPTLAQVYNEHSNKFSSDFELRVCGVGVSNEMNLNQDSMNEQNLYKKGHDISQTKTIKFRSSMRNI